MALEGVEFVTLRPVADTESTRLADADRDLATFCFGLPATRAVGLTTSSAPLLARRCSPLRISPTSNLGLGRAAEVLRSLLVCFGWTSTVAGAYPALDGGVPFTLPVLVWGARWLLVGHPLRAPVLVSCCQVHMNSHCWTLLPLSRARLTHSPSASVTRTMATVGAEV